MNNAYNTMQVQKRTGSKNVPRASFKQDASVLHSFHSRFKGIEKFLRTLHELTLGQNTEQEIEQEYNHALLTAAIQKVVSYPYTNIYSTRINQSFIIKIFHYEKEIIIYSRVTYLKQ